MVDSRPLPDRDGASSHPASELARLLLLLLVPLLSLSLSVCVSLSSYLRVQGSTKPQAREE